MKVQNYLKGYLPFESEFSHKYACWAYNHRGWAKMKKSNKRLAKRKERRVFLRELFCSLYSNQFDISKGGQHHEDEQIV